MKKLAILAFLMIFSVGMVSAASCLTVNAQTTKAYLAEIPSINSQLSSCNVQIPSSASSLIGDGNIMVTIAMSGGTTKQFYITITKNQVTSIFTGPLTLHSYEVQMSEATMDALLTSNDATNDILRGIKNKDIVINAKGFWNNIKWFFAKWFLPNPGPSPGPNPPQPNPPQPTGNPSTTPPIAPAEGKPDYCDDTYLPGHREYAANKVQWDKYSADTDDVCQSQYGRGVPGPCVYTVQLSIEGKPYYLCWYNE